jgi:hypothetical protein
MNSRVRAAGADIHRFGGVARAAVAETSGLLQPETEGLLFPLFFSCRFRVTELLFAAFLVER